MCIYICICAKKRNFSLWIETAGILSVDVVVVVVFVVVYAIRVYGTVFFLLSRLSYRLADISDVFLRPIMTDHQQEKGKERRKKEREENFWFARLISYKEKISTQSEWFSFFSFCGLVCTRKEEKTKKKRRSFFP